MKSNGINFVIGDFFAWRGAADLVWDRAAMVALPPAMRPRYVAKVKELAAGGSLLLSTFTYDEAVMSGPPFSLSDDEVRKAYPEIELLSEVDVLDAQPRFKERGHQYLLQRAWLASVEP